MKLFNKNGEQSESHEVIFIDKDTHIQGDVRAQKIILEGALTGSIWADELVMKKGASIQGKVFVKMLKLDDGATCHCELHLNGELSYQGRTEVISPVGFKDQVALPV